MLRSKLFIKIMAIIALVAFVSVTVFTVIAPLGAGAVSVKEAQRQQQQATAKKEAAKSKQSEEIARREELDKEITAVQKEIDAFQEKIDQKTAAIDASQKKIDVLTVELKKKNSEYSERAKALVKKGGVSYTEIILKSKSIDDMLTRMSVIKRVAKYDSERLKQIETSMDEVDKLKAELLVQKEEVIGLKSEQDEKKAELTTYREESQAIIDNLQKDIEKYEREYSLAKEAEARAKAEAESLRRQYDTSGASTLPANYTAGQFLWPSPVTRRVTSPYGYRIHPVTGKSRFHAGIDIGAAYGTNIVASDAGVVIVAGYNAGGYGNYVVINHGGGYTTLYAHCSSLNVSRGQSVSRGQVIAKCGSTGMSTGPHIHYEVQLNGKTTNPMQYFN